MHWLFILLVVVSGSAFAGATQWVDFELDQGYITIPIKVHGQAGRAMLDSGANINGINSDFVLANPDKFSQSGKIEVEGAFGKSKRSTYNNVPVELYGAEFRLDSMVEMRDFKPLVLLGNAFFNLNIVQLDYPNQRLRLIDRDSVNLQKLKNIDMKVDKRLQMPIVKIRLNKEKTIWALLDTGNTGGMFVERYVVKRTDWLEKYPAGGGTFDGVTKTATVENFYLPEIQFGPFGIENVLTTVAAEGESFIPVSRSTAKTGSHIKSKNVKGIVGYEVFKHFVLTIDYKTGRMHIGIPDDLSATESGT